MSPTVRHILMKYCISYMRKYEVRETFQSQLPYFNAIFYLKCLNFAKKLSWGYEMWYKQSLYATLLCGNIIKMLSTQEQ